MVGAVASLVFAISCMIHSHAISDDILRMTWIQLQGWFPQQHVYSCRRCWSSWTIIVRYVDAFVFKLWELSRQLAKWWRSGSYPSIDVGPPQAPAYHSLCTGSWCKCRCLLNEAIVRKDFSTLVPVQLVQKFSVPCFRRKIKTNKSLL